MYKEPLTVRFAHWLLRKHEGRNLGLESNIVSAKHRNVTRPGPSIENRDTVSFTIHPASGGYVVESTFYDEKNDRHNRHLHIITSQEDFSEELGKAVFMDMLKNR